MFNFGIVCSAKYDSLPYEAVIRRLASTFTEMEIQNEYLSKEGTSESEGRRSIGDLLEIVREDLNNYNECMIPVGKSLLQCEWVLVNHCRRCEHDQHETISISPKPTTC